MLSENTQVSNSMKIRAVGAEFFHIDTRTDMIKLTVVFAILRKRLNRVGTLPRRNGKGRENIYREAEDGIIVAL